MNRTRIEAQMEAQRWTAAQASREQATLDPRSVLLVALEYRRQGREAEARALVAEYRQSVKGATK